MKEISEVSTMLCLFSAKTERFLSIYGIHLDGSLYPGFCSDRSLALLSPRLQLSLNLFGSLQIKFPMNPSSSSYITTLQRTSSDTPKSHPCIVYSQT